MAKRTKVTSKTKDGKNTFLNQEKRIRMFYVNLDLERDSMTIRFEIETSVKESNLQFVRDKMLNKISVKELEELL